MKKNFFTEVTILFIPPLFNQVDLSKNKHFFLNLCEISESKSLFSTFDLDERKDYIAFAERINEEDFSEKVISLINEEENKFIESNNDANDELKLSTVLINYPINKGQFNLLYSKLKSLGIKISKMIIASPLSFEIMSKAKNKYFICPVCLKSYDKEKNISGNNYVCPVDNNKFKFSEVDKFNDFFTEYYLKNSLEVIQEFTDNDFGDLIAKEKIIHLSIESENNVEENLNKALNDILKQ